MLPGATLLLSGFLLSQGQETAARRPAEAAGQAAVEHLNVRSCQL
jgi:hypothetical protein